MFWDNFVILCNKKGKSPNGACAELGFSKNTATKWKHGSVPYDTTLQKIADYFGVTVEYLRGNEKQTTKKPPSAPSGQKGVRIPVLGNVAAGIPLEAITDIEDYEEISEAMAAGGEYVALRIHGDSMEPRMTEGDVVIVRVQDTITSGEVGVFIINGDEATCKRIKKTPDGIMLISNNPSYEPMFFSNQQVQELPVRVFGKVVELRAKFW